MVIAAGVSSPGCSRRSGTMVMSSTRSPIDSITAMGRLFHRRDSGQLFDRRVDSRLCERDVFQLAGEVRVIGGHVEVAVPRKAEQDGAPLACLPRGSCFFGNG